MNNELYRHQKMSDKEFSDTWEEILLLAEEIASNARGWRDWRKLDGPAGELKRLSNKLHWHTVATIIEKEASK